MILHSESSINEIAKVLTPKAGNVSWEHCTKLLQWALNSPMRTQVLFYVLWIYVLFGEGHASSV